MRRFKLVNPQYSAPNWLTIRSKLSDLKGRGALPLAQTGVIFLEHSDRAVCEMSVVTRKHWSRDGKLSSSMTGLSPGPSSSTDSTLFTAGVSAVQNR